MELLHSLIYLYPIYLYPIILDYIIIPLNEFRTHIIHYFTIYSYNRTLYIDILSLDFMFVGIFAALLITCTESIFGLYSFHISVLFKIIR